MHGCCLCHLACPYTICAFSIWSPNGWLTKMGIIDYSIGFVIHLFSGVIDFIAAYWVIINYHIIIYHLKKKKFIVTLEIQLFFFFLPLLLWQAVIKKNIFFI